MFIYSTMDQWVAELGQRIKHFQFIDALRQLQSLSAQEHEALRNASPSFYRYLHTLASSIEHSIRNEKVYDEMSFVKFKEAYDEAVRISVNANMSESVNRQAEANARSRAAAKEYSNMGGMANRLRRAEAERRAAENRNKKRNTQAERRATENFQRRKDVQVEDFEQLFRQSYPGLNNRDKVIRLARDWLGITLDPSKKDSFLKAKLNYGKYEYLNTVANIEKYAKCYTLYTFL